MNYFTDEEIENIFEVISNEDEVKPIDLKNIIDEKILKISEIFEEVIKNVKIDFLIDDKLESFIIFQDSKNVIMFNEEFNENYSFIIDEIIKSYLSKDIIKGYGGFDGIKYKVFKEDNLIGKIKILI